jgi:hypothetical protein
MLLLRSRRLESSFQFRERELHANEARTRGVYFTRMYPGPILMASTGKLEVSATVLVMLTGSEGTSERADDFELNNESFNEQITSFSADRIKIAKATCKLWKK